VTIEAGGLLAASLVASALGSSLGMAGGIFIVPLLTLVAGASFPAAVAVSLISVIACSCASAPGFLGARLVNLRLAVVLELATVGGAVVGVALSGTVPPAILYGLFTIVLVVSAVQMMIPRRSAPQAGTGWARRLRLSSTVPGADGTEEHYEVGSLPAGLSLMFGAGTLSALLGIGSGVLKIPAMDAALRLPLKVSSGTANLMIGVTSTGTAAAYLILDRVDLRLVGPVVLGSVLGAILGARILVRANSAVLRLVFIVVLGLVAVPMGLTALGIGR
jgi:uncharacterized protein